MNPTIDLLRSHRSIRRYKPEPVTDDQIAEAVRAGQAASTSSAVQAYCLIRVTDAETRAGIAELAGGQRSVAEAGAFFVVCADARRHRLAASEAGLPYAGRLEAFLVGVIDAALFAQNAAVAFESMGLGICYIGGIRNDLRRLDALLDVPEGVYPLFGMCVGVPDQSPTERPRLPLEAVLMSGRYAEDREMLDLVRAYDEEYTAYLRDRGAPPEQTRLGWSARVARLLSEPRREDVAEYYAAKGARLD